MKSLLSSIYKRRGDASAENIHTIQEEKSVRMRGGMIASLTMAVLCCIMSTAHALQGSAVYYKPPYTPSACYGMQNRGAMVAGVRDDLWANGAACGRRYRVSCIAGANSDPHPCKWGKSVVVTVVDFCRSPCYGILNLSQDAFSAIANTQAGKVEVRFDQV